MVCVPLPCLLGLVVIEVILSAFSKIEGGENHMKMEKLLPDRWIEPKMHEKDHHQCENATSSLLSDKKIKCLFISVIERICVGIPWNGGDNPIHHEIAMKTKMCL